ncbi:MAG: aminofutalosine synthase MqnE [Chthoniobacterales bacterium]
MSLKLPISKELIPILEKVQNQERISTEDALTLYASDDLHGIGRIANIVRERINGNVATYVFNRYINYSNICVLSCQFCAFSAKKRDDHAFEMAIPDILDASRKALALGITEIHMVGGLHPTLKGEWYLELVSSLRALDEKLVVKAFTAIEIRHLAHRVFKKSIRETLEMLRDAGLGALTGGGAEVFDEGIRDQICRGKESGEEWLEVHRIWHEMGMRSTCTMLYGHIESHAQRVDHFRQLRELQDQTHGFTGFIPFAFVPETTILSHIPQCTGLDQLKTLAISRIFLDNIDHITAYWVSLGLPLAQLALSYGVDDLHGTIIEEKIFHMAGAKTPQEQSILMLERAIREAGLIPSQRNTYYERITSTFHKAEAVA